MVIIAIFNTENSNYDHFKEKGFQWVGGGGGKRPICLVTAKRPKRQRQTGLWGLLGQKRQICKTTGKGDKKDAHFYVPFFFVLFVPFVIFVLFVFVHFVPFVLFVLFVFVLFVLFVLFVPFVCVPFVLFVFCFCPFCLVCLLFVCPFLSCLSFVSPLAPDTILHFEFPISTCYSRYCVYSLYNSLSHALPCTPCPLAYSSLSLSWSAWHIL